MRGKNKSWPWRQPHLRSFLSASPASPTCPYSFLAFVFIVKYISVQLPHLGSATLTMSPLLIKLWMSALQLPLRPPTRHVRSTVFPKGIGFVGNCYSSSGPMEVKSDTWPCHQALPRHHNGNLAGRRSLFSMNCVEIHWEERGTDTSSGSHSAFLLALAEPGVLQPAVCGLDILKGDRVG